MSVEKLLTQNFRNLKSQSLHLHPDLNFILGDNGSGKSSLLEAIFSSVMASLLERQNLKCLLITTVHNLL